MAERQAISQRQEALQAEIETAFRQAKNVEKKAAGELDRLDKQVALYALSHLLDDLKRKHQGLPEVLVYLDEVRDDILDNANQFRADPKEQTAPAFLMTGTKGLLLSRYAVNVLVDNSSTKGAPGCSERWQIPTMVCKDHRRRN